jgi:AcrR family transcriptional regulator
VADETGAGNDLIYATKQARSRQTLDRLLEAAEDVLATRGLDEATVPVIAEHAGVSVGIVYRRFKDKDALLRAVYERFFSRSREHNRAALDPARWAGAPAAEVVRAIIGGIVHGYRQHRGLLRALFTYAQTHPDEQFRRRAEELNGEAFRALGDLLLARGAEWSHPHPDAAVRFGLVVVASTLRQLMLADEGTRHPLATTDEELARELTRLYSRYLGIAEGGPLPPPS